MKRICSAFFIICMVFSISFAASFKKNAKVYVSVKQATLKSDTGFFSKQTGSVSYGDVLTILESDSKNSKVQLVSDSSVCGWISNGSLTSKKIVKTSGGTGSTSSDELALAGKGFSAEAEKAFKDSGNAAAANYSKVDEIEKITVSKSELSDFISDGHLNGGVQ